LLKPSGLYLPSRQIINPVGCMFAISSNTMFYICHWWSAERGATLGELVEQFLEVTVFSCMSMLQSVTLPSCSREKSRLPWAGWASQLIEKMITEIGTNIYVFVETGQKLRSSCRRTYVY
jgi:hypothetical protein